MLRPLATVLLATGLLANLAAADITADQVKALSKATANLKEGATTKVTVMIDGKPYEVTAMKEGAGFRVNLGDKPVSVVPTFGPSGILLSCTVDGKNYGVLVANGQLAPQEGNQAPRQNTQQTFAQSHGGGFNPLKNLPTSGNTVSTSGFIDRGSSGNREDIQLNGNANLIGNTNFTLSIGGYLGSDAQALVNANDAKITQVAAVSGAR